MKIAIVHDFLFKLGGAERVVKKLLKIFPEADLFTLLYDQEKVEKVFPPNKVNTSFLQKYPKFIRKRHRLLTSKMPRAIEEIDLSAYDLILSSSGAFSHGALTSSQSKHICYCHSPMRYAFDWHAEYVKENNIQGFKKIYYQKLIKDLRVWENYAADRPDHYIAISKTVEKRIKKYFRKEAKIIHPPVNVKKFKVNENHSNYFLIVSTLTQYKKIDLAIALFNKLGRKLVIVGDGPDRGRLQNMANKNIEFLGFLSDLEVKEYIENCRALIFPGEEDFGITPIEAMAAGKPVLAFGKGGALETIIAEHTGEFFYEANVSSMEDGLARLLHNEKFYNPNKIREHALKFDESIFERKIRKYVKSVLTF